jgi:hypothetical protein
MLHPWWFLYVCPVCTDCFHVHCLSNFHADGVGLDEQAWHTRLIIWFQTCSIRQPLNYMLYGQLHHPTEWTCSPSPDQILKNQWENLSIAPFWIHCVQKNVGLIILVTLVVYQTPTLKLCSRNLCISLGSSADQYLLFWVICGCLGKTMHIANVI